MAKTKYLAWIVAAGVVLTAAWYFLFSATTPSGQPPLSRLATDTTFVTEFNRTNGDARMVLLLSPT